MEAARERAMTVETGPAGTQQTVSLWGRSTPPSWPWRRRAMVLAVAAQLITISALLRVDPLGVSAASGPLPFARAAAWAGAAVILAGLIGGILHTGLFFAPALIVLVVGAVKLSPQPTRP